MESLFHNLNYLAVRFIRSNKLDFQSMCINRLTSKKLLLSFCLGVAVLVNTDGQATAQKIQYGHALPRALARVMPKGAKSLFWGKVNPQKGTPPLAIHLFALRPKKEVSKDTDSSGDGIYHFALDVFEPKKKTWHRINRVPVTYKSIMWGPVTISMNLTWLNKTKRTAPVLMFDAFTTEALLPGNYGDGVFVVFEDGWKGAAQVQSFGSGASNFSSLSYGVGYDEKGILQVMTSETSNDATTESKTFNWNGLKFVFTPGTETKHNPADEYNQ